MQGIGIHLPDKAQFSDKSDYFFVQELEKSIRMSGRYRPVRTDLKKLRLSSEKGVRSFLERENIVAMVHHDSHFYSTNTRYRRNVALLDKHIPFLNSVASQKLGYDKITTKRILREKKIPVLDDEIVDTPDALLACMKEHVLYVVKPSDSGAGNGVRLLKRQGQKIFQHTKNEWKEVGATGGVRDDGTKYIRLQHKQSAPALVCVGVLFILALTFPILFPVLALATPLFLMFIFLIFVLVFKQGYTYCPMLVEPYFNDSEDVFTSLRCTVIGDEVIEAVKRTNLKNITSNISSGGTAEKVELSAEQKQMAVDAKNSIGADYAGVDLLTRGDESVIGEVNIGPFTLFCTYTGVNVGKIFGEYLIAKCDRFT